MPPVEPGPVQRTVVEICQSFATENVAIDPSQALEFVFAALGIWTGALAKKHRTPLTRRVDHFPCRPPAFHLHLRGTTERVERIMRKHRFLADQPLKAQLLAALVVRAVNSTGVTVDTHRVIFENQFAEYRFRILKALVDPDFLPIHASAAIGGGLLPMPDRAGQQERLDDVAPHLVQEVAKQGAFFWPCPSPDLADAKSAFLDTIEFDPRGALRRASLGLNFVVLVPWPLLRSQSNYRLYSPVMHFYPGDRSWVVSAGLPRNVDDAELSRAGQKSLTELIGKPPTELPRLTACPTCLTLYLDGRGQPSHRCGSAGIDAAVLAGVIRRFRARGIRHVTTEQLHSELSPHGRALPERAVLERFLSRHVRTFGMRLYGGLWSFVGERHSAFPPPAEMLSPK